MLESLSKISDQHSFIICSALWQPMSCGPELTGCGRPKAVHSSRHHHGARREEGEELERTQARAWDRCPQSWCGRPLQEVPHKHREWPDNRPGSRGPKRAWQKRTDPSAHNTRMGMSLLEMLSTPNILSFKLMSLFRSNSANVCSPGLRCSSGLVPSFASSPTAFR